ncbi:hypothetical protein HK099_001448 [Clydaea vesicula]|uniref:Uncharacterized protein n=1 Tax=Clydaea vesicula TaxID=447962 RepID=A0AAD5XWZ8_9FUNG|nr:hypothetical protein HK099_001448 [Clydaea vesicula]
MILEIDEFRIKILKNEFESLLNVEHEGGEFDFMLRGIYKTTDGELYFVSDHGITWI